jgi:hypothetical protein
LVEPMGFIYHNSSGTFYRICTLGDCLPGVERVERLYTEAEKGGNQVAEFMCVGRVW